MCLAWHPYHSQISVRSPGTGIQLPAFSQAKSIERYALPSSDCYPIDVVPGLSRLFVDFCAGEQAVRPFYASLAARDGLAEAMSLPDHWSEVVDLLAGQNASPAAAPALKALRAGAGTVLTGQQVGLLGGPLYTPFKAATALARARQATAAGQPHVAIFWLATEDHDFAEINHVTFPSRKELLKLIYAKTPCESRLRWAAWCSTKRSSRCIEQAWELLGSSDAMDALAAAYKPGRTFGQAFAEFYSKAFAAQGLLVLDAAGTRGASPRDARFCGRRSSARTNCMRRCWSETSAGGGGISRTGRGGAAVELACF